MKVWFDLHTHTVASGHAFGTLKENIEEASHKGLWALGISDHAERMPGTTHPIFFDNYKVIHKEVMGVRIFSGIEANICDFNGNIDVQVPLLEKLDYVIASLHPPCIQSGTVQDNTAALIGAMKNPYVKVIGHPDDSRYPVDYDVLVSAAKEWNVVMELNNSSLLTRSTRQNGRVNAKKLLETCMKYRVSILIGSDAHIWYDVGGFSEAFALLKETKFPEELVVNASKNRIQAVLNHNGPNTEKDHSCVVSY